MKILIASDSFKSTLSSRDVGKIVQEELAPYHTADFYPWSDGGEGFLESWEGLFPGHLHTIPCKDPLGNDIACSYILTDDHTAIIESAKSCGPGLLKKSEWNPLRSGTFGLGLLVRDALARGARKVHIGLGGSVTNDGGIGLLMAMGARLTDHQGIEIVIPEAGEMVKIAGMDLREMIPRFRGGTFFAVCDVDNPLLGPQGATRVYGPQKGASPAMVETLEAGMTNLAGVAKKTTGQDYSGFPGAGAAGGLGFCLKSFFGADLLPGTAVLANLTGLDEEAHRYDLIITGEGRLDKQTASGKVPMGMIRLGKKYSLPVACICGINELEGDIGFARIFAVVPTHATAEESISQPELCLRRMIRSELIPWINDQADNHAFK